MSLQWTFTGEPITRSLTDKCIILDIDETLLHTQPADTYNYAHLAAHPAVSREVFVVDLSMREGLIQVWGHKRPNLDEFIRFCFSYFKIVAVWSAGGFDYVHNIVDYIFRHHRRPHLIFTHEDCSHKEVMTKPIAEMISKVPGLSAHMRLENTWIVDDRVTNFLPNPRNGILIPPFSPGPQSPVLYDIRLTELIKWFSRPEVMNCSNVQTLKPQIFAP